jgi:hypothetical protein
MNGIYICKAAHGYACHPRMGDSDSRPAWIKSSQGPVARNKPGLVHNCNVNYRRGIGRRIVAPWLAPEKKH